MAGTIARSDNERGFWWSPSNQEIYGIAAAARPVNFALGDNKCWADPARNAPDQIAQGKISFDFDFTPPYPAERIAFRSRMVNDYLEELFT